MDSHRVLEQCQQSGGRVELVTASINRVMSPSDFPDYQPTLSHEGSIPSTLVVRCANVSSFRHEFANLGETLPCSSHGVCGLGTCSKLAVGSENVFVGIKLWPRTCCACKRVP